MSKRNLRSLTSSQASKNSSSEPSCSSIAFFVRSMVDGFNCLVSCLSILSTICLLITNEQTRRGVKVNVSEISKRFEIIWLRGELCDLRVDQCSVVS